MRSGLTGILSEPAADLYGRLVEAGGLPLAEQPEADSSAAQELIAKGFARERHVGEARLVPVEPISAIDNAILVRQRQILDQYQSLLRLRDEMAALQRAYLASAVGAEEPTESVRVLTDRREIGALSVELGLGAREEVRSLENEHFSRPPDPRSARTVPPELIERGVRLRNVYSRAAMDVPGAREMLRLSVAAGWQCRVYPHVPMKLVSVDDDAALVPLGRTGMEGALLVRSPVVVAALNAYFELLWRLAVPVDGGSAGIPAEQADVLRLVLAGLTDAAIARHLGVSDRTVRRHVGALMERFRATNRVTLAVMALREGAVE